MPAYRFRSDQYVSRGFKDLAISFNANPSTDDFGAVKNERAITQSVRNLILTIFGERPFQPSIGSRVKLRDNSDLNEIQVELEYKITGEQVIQEVTFLLEKT